jgi:hypothetical protein
MITEKIAITGIGSTALHPNNLAALCIVFSAVSPKS